MSIRLKGRINFWVCQLSFDFLRGRRLTQGNSPIVFVRDLCANVEAQRSGERWNNFWIPECKLHEKFFPRRLSFCTPPASRGTLKLNANIFVLIRNLRWMWKRCEQAALSFKYFLKFVRRSTFHRVFRRCYLLQAPLRYHDVDFLTVQFCSPFSRKLSDQAPNYVALRCAGTVRGLPKLRVKFYYLLDILSLLKLGLFVDQVERLFYQLLA